MKFEIAYISQSGNTEKLAHGIADRFPPNRTFVTDLSYEKITGKADVYLIGFGVNKGTVPLKIMETLDELCGKTILFFITCGFEPTREYLESIERKVAVFLPDDCDYRGLFMCQGEFPNDVLQMAKAKLLNEPNNKVAKKVVDDAELSAGHPHSVDFENAYNFICKRLEKQI